ncbi:filamin-binding LIM protein 1 [Nothobranchius furzeri]|uniref:Filamin binding LIM protein 1 n=4 Tax=Nothobranchius TaxID=28779 RepID=A0A1A8UYM9_NOTFU|nr:filamin-binding LIM protein 1 [Nothobranchius furzeri]KAF7208887.1 filamin binding LIM protein 1 [Nothobranchius furzeri]
MASAAPPKRMVSSVFITLASPHRATVSQQQPALQASTGPVRDKQHNTVRATPGENAPVYRYKKQDQPSPDTYSSVNSRDWTHGRPSTSSSSSDPLSPKVAPNGSTKAQLQEVKDQTKRIIPGIHSEELLPPPPTDVPPSSPGGKLSEELSLPPPPQTCLLHLQSQDQHPVSNNKVERCTPSGWSTGDYETHEILQNSQDTNRESKDVCGFCRKTVAFPEPALEALNRTYHESCFHCRSCHVPLAGKQYYNKAGIPLCESCYQASLELCWSCGEVITDHIIRALERAYHSFCFTCKTCKQQIGEQAFAQGEVGEVYCLKDYYKKYAPRCSACNHLIIPKDDGTDSYTVECLGHSYHENCYRCEVCAIQLSPEPNENGCYPLDGKILCKACHVDLVSEQQ